MINNIIILTRPEATCPWLRYQIGIGELRTMQEPVRQADGRWIFVNNIGKTVPVFHLLGFSETLQGARRMAGLKEPTE